jgi:hypothetical protein
MRLPANSSLKPALTVSVDRAAVLFQVLSGMLAFAVRRVEEQRRWWAGAGKGPFIADVCP